MIARLNRVLLTDKEMKLGPEVWRTDKVLFEDPWPQNVMIPVREKHRNVKGSDANSKEGWADCLDEKHNHSSHNHSKRSSKQIKKPNTISKRTSDSSSTLKKVSMNA
jgi:hypothetical protein